MRFETAIEHLVDNYRYAKSKVEIRDEVAWALYHTWKEADDRKTEPSNSEKPNNSTISKMEQVDKDINVRSKDEPTTQTETQNSNLIFEKRTMRDCYNCKRYETEGECIECHYEPKDEPQDEYAKEYEELGLRKLKELRKDEPQKNCENCGTPKNLCVYCIKEDRMWTPKTEPNSSEKPNNSEGRSE